MEGQIFEPLTYSAELYAQSFFKQSPTDSRFLQVTHHKFMPTSSLESRTIEFQLDRYDTASVIMIQNTIVRLQCVITKSDLVSLPDTGKNVGPVNNFLHSIFESVRININDVGISINPSSYPYKAYFNNCLTYGTMVKATQLLQEGWVSDLSGHMEPGTDNTGFIDRCSLFRENNESDKPYRKEGVILMGRLQHDLCNIQTGLPPHTKVKIELEKSDSKFCLLRQSDDKEDYQLKITNIVLYIPIAILSQPVYQHINSIQSSKTESRPIGIHYRRTEIR